MKKISKLVLLFAGALTISGCRFNVDPSDVMDNFYYKRRISIAESNIVVNVGEKKFVEIEVDNLGIGGDIDTLTYTSCDNKIAKAKYGRYETEEEYFDGMYVEGLSEGTTSIIASFKNASDSCEVTVIKNDEIPYIHLFDNKLYIENGNEYLLGSEIYYKGNVYTPLDLNVVYDYTFIDGYEEIVELYQDDETNELIVNPISEGNTQLLISSVIDNVEVYSLLEVTVTAPGVGIVIKNEGFEHKISNTYATKIYVADFEEYKQSVDLEIEIYNGDEPVPAQIHLTSSDETIAQVDGYTIKGIKKGIAVISGTYEDIDLTINVIVDKPTVYSSIVNKNIEVDVNPWFEIENPSLIDGINGVYLDSLDTEVNLFEKVEFGQIFLDKDTMHSVVKQFGEDKHLYIETNKIYVDVGLTNIYSKIIRTYDDLLSFGQIASQYVTERFNFNGYFILGNNITCPVGSATPVAFDRKVNFGISGIGECLDTNVGFNGTFDGKGYTIFNYKPSGFGSFITWLTKDGVIKNIGFENASLVSSLIDESTNPAAILIANGQGTISNIYVNYKEITTNLGKYKAIYCSTFNYAGTMNASSVFVKADKASIQGDFDILGKMICDGVYSLGGTHINGNSDFGSDTPVDGRIFSCSGTFEDFKSESEMREHLFTQSVISNWNKNYWGNLEYGIPTWNSCN